jgi:E3 ubiquitin-protein ligase TRIP12
MLGREDEPATAGASPDVMLLAARALANLVDVLPSSCSAVVHYGAIQCFCARLLTIEYMDLAEQVVPSLVFLLLFFYDQSSSLSKKMIKVLLTHLLFLPSQSLQALKKISLEHPTACLRAGALMAVLSYLDFFSTGVQVESSDLLSAVLVLCTVCIYLHLFPWGHVFVVEGSLVYRRKYLQEAAVRCF